MLRALTRRSVLLFGFVPLFPNAASAQDHTWPILGPPFVATASDIRAAAAKISAEPFTEATVFLERDSYSIDVVGRTTYRHTMIYRIETQAGVENWSEIRMHWAPWYQNAPEIHCRVIAPDGTVSMLDPKTITDGPARQESEDTYTDARVRKAPLPGVIQGAIVEEETVSTDKEPFFAAGEIYGDSFSRDVPILRAELRIDVPASVHFRYKVYNLPDADVHNEIEGDVRHFKLAQGYLPGRSDSDIPLATHNIVGPNVRFSTGESWASVASAYRQLAEARIEPDKVKPLLPALGSDRNANIARIVAKLHKEVRYTGIEFGEAGLQPASAAEVLKRHYGDCKDKAALLVAMLRAAGVPANLSLLDTGPGADVETEMAGMSFFDHAIVYVPAADGSAPLWIDATAEFAEVGTLPYSDHGRLALVIADGTTALTSTPESRSEDDHLTEIREVTLANYGPASITETSLTHGDIDSSYRSIYGGDLSREERENLEKYAKNAYLAKTLARIGHGDPHEVTQPFALKLEMKEARRGNTLIDDAFVGIPFVDIFYRLPEWFRTDPKVEGEKLTPQQEEDRKRAVAARTSSYDTHPFISEWQYTIVPPEGFVLRASPESKTTQMGPASFTQHYETNAAGVIKATLKFEQPKSRMTGDETLALRDAVLEAYKQDMISVRFDQAGAKLVAAGKIRDGLAADRTLIDSHPLVALHHAQIAYAYLKAGLGDKARAEAERAVKLDPKLPAAFRTLGWVCQFNQIGVQFAPGFDLDCAISAYKRAVELDPDDSDTVASLAYLNEYDHDGERYAAHARLADAIAGYRAIKQKDKSAGEQYDDHVLFDLLYSGSYAEVLAELEKLPSSATRNALAITATVAGTGGAKGVSAGVDRANLLHAGADQRNSALATAGSELLRLHLYSEAADILSAAAEGQPNAAAITQQAAIFRQIRPWKGDFLPDSDARSVVQRMYMAYMSGQFDATTADKLLARHAYSSEDAWQRNARRSEQTRGLLHLTAGRSDMSAAVLLDVFAGNLKLKATGDDESGYRITLDSLGSKSRQYFVVQERQGYRIVTDGNTPAEAGNEALYLLKSGQEKCARSLLDWTRDQMHRGGGDDPLSGSLFPRFWTSGDTGDATKMRIAAAALVAADKDAITDLIPELGVAWEKASGDETRLNLSLLLATAYRATQDGDHLKEVGSEVLGKYPDSYTAMGFVASADALMKNWDDWKQMLNARLAKHPDDDVLIRMKAGLSESRGDWAAARAARQELVEKGKAAAGDYNMLGWTGLFDGKVDEEVIKAARQGTMLTNNASFPELHTLACLYAYQGKTVEARDLLLKAMNIGNMSLPNPEVWFGFGSIYEQYGVTDAAIEAYSKVEKPSGWIDPSSTYVLAQARIKALGTTQTNHQGPAASEANH